MKVICTYRGCRKTFASIPNRRRHIKICHLNYKPHECEVCMAKFSSRQNLNTHMYRHDTRKIEIPEDSQPVGSIESIPNLTTLVQTSTDVDIRPFTKILRIYPYPASSERKALPKINRQRQKQCKRPLPPFQAI